MTDDDKISAVVTEIQHTLDQAAWISGIYLVTAWLLVFCAAAYQAWKHRG